MPTGGDGTAYYGEEVIGEKVMSKKDIKKRDEIADAISTKDMKDRYGDKNVKYAIATKIVMDKKKKKKKDMNEALDKKDKPFVKKLVGKLRKGSKTHAKQADDLEKAMKENTAIESELVIQDWNSDDIKFTEIETVDIIKAKPIKESVDWRVQLIEKFGFSKNLGKLRILGTRSAKMPKIRGMVKARKGFDSIPFRKLKIDALKSPVQTPLSKLRAQDVTKRTDIEKLTKKYKKVVKDPNFKGIKKKFITQPKSPYPVSKDNIIMPKPGDASKTNKLIDKYKIDKVKRKTDIGSEKKILDAQQDPDLKKLDKISKAQDNAIKSLSKQGVDLSAKTGKTTIPKGFKTTKSGNVTINPKKKNDGKGTALARYAAGAAIGYAVAKSQDRKPSGVEPSMPDERSLPDMEIPPSPMIKAKNEKKRKTVMASYDWRAQLDDDVLYRLEKMEEDWQKVNRKDKTDGLSQKAVNAYRRENPGSKLKTAVTKDPKKLKKGSKSAKRRLSFCRRMKGMKKKLTSAKTSRDPDSRINKALRRWNC